jgi:SAM-dependent methyltransferase
VIGIDLAEAMVAASTVSADGRANAPMFQVGDALAPPLPAASFDIVSNRQVVWTLLDPERAFRNWFALLRPGGTLLSIHLRHMNKAGGGYSEEAQEALPSLPYRASSESVMRGDPRYPRPWQN